MVTAQARRIAHEAATGLTALSETRQERWRRLAVNGLRYAAVFAAGLLVAFTVVDLRHRAEHGQDCTRHDAVRDGQPRTAAEIRVLVVSCSVCHDRPQKVTDEHNTSSLYPRRVTEYEWLEQIFKDSSLRVAERSPQNVPALLPFLPS